MRAPAVPSPPMIPQLEDDPDLDDPVTVAVTAEEVARAKAGAVMRPPEATIPVTPAVDWAAGPPPIEAHLRDQIAEGFAANPEVERTPSAAPASSRAPAVTPSTGGMSSRGLPVAPPLEPAPMSAPYPSQSMPLAPGYTSSRMPMPVAAPLPESTRLLPAPPNPSVGAMPVAHAPQLTEAWASAPSGSYSSSGERDEPRSKSEVRAPVRSMPIGYVIASAFFLAVAVVGFGLYLAFEVISL